MPAVPRLNSANVAIGAAAGFVVLSAALALLPERTDLQTAKWTLRGSIPPTQPELRAPAVRQARL